TGGEFWVEIRTDAGALSRSPSVTTSWTTYVPAWSTRKVGWIAVGSKSVAALPAGRLVNCHRKVKASPSTSLERLPSRVTVVPTAAVWSGPALATGREFWVETCTVSGALSTLPSFTTSSAM